MDELTALEDWAAPLLASLQEGERRKLARKIGTALRRSQSQRIGRQRAPDGTPYAPRKEPLRDKSGRVKRKKMFAKLRQAKFFKVSASANEVSVGFMGRVSRIARVHQEGMTERVRQSGPKATYARRRLLGISEHNKEEIMKSILAKFSNSPL
ncbi:phage virion morphogenesis protein [Xanthomonas arboricola]